MFHGTAKDHEEDIIEDRDLRWGRMTPVEDGRNVRSNIDVEPKRSRSSEPNGASEERKTWKNGNLLHDGDLGKPGDFEKVCHDLDLLP